MWFLRVMTLMELPDEAWQQCCLNFAHLNKVFIAPEPVQTTRVITVRDHKPYQHEASSEEVSPRSELDTSCFGSGAYA